MKKRTWSLRVECILRKIFWSGAFYSLAAFFLFFCFCTSSFAVSPVQQGKVSWYGAKFQGKKTASGAVFNKNSLTAAHKKFPFGTVLRVSSLEDKTSVLVEVTDRGPFKKGRLLDVSKKAAQILGFLERGIANTVVEVVGKPDGTLLNSSNAFYVCLSKNAHGQGAKQLLSRMRSDYVSRSIQYISLAGGRTPSLCLGPFSTFAEAKASFELHADWSNEVSIIEAPRPSFTQSHLSQSNR